MLSQKCQHVGKKLAMAVRMFVHQCASSASPSARFRGGARGRAPRARERPLCSARREIGSSGFGRSVFLGCIGADFLQMDIIFLYVCSISDLQDLRIFPPSISLLYDSKLKMLETIRRRIRDFNEIWNVKFQQKTEKMHMLTNLGNSFRWFCRSKKQVAAWIFACPKNGILLFFLPQLS